MDQVTWFCTKWDQVTWICKIVDQVTWSAQFAQGQITWFLEFEGQVTWIRKIVDQVTWETKCEDQITSTTILQKWTRLPGGQGQGHALWHVGRTVGHLSGTWSSTSLLSSCPVPFCMCVVAMLSLMPRPFRATILGGGHTSGPDACPPATRPLRPTGRDQVIGPTFGRDQVIWSTR